MGCDKSVFESDLLRNVVSVVLGQLILQLLKLFLGNKERYFEGLVKFFELGVLFLDGSGVL